MATCGGCGRDLPSAEFAFCPYCGAPSTGPAEEQRKTVTVLFADLVGSTELGSEVDPEVLRGVMQSYWATARTAIERHGGSVAKFIGDAVVGVFGVPAAREDDAARALRAARDLITDVAQVSKTLEQRTGAPIRVRIGVNTGAAVVDLSSADVGLMVGDVANVGARLEQAAPPGQVYVGATTHELTRDAAEFEDLPPLTVKGKDEPLRAYRLLSVHALTDVRRRRRFSGPMVGRRRQMQQARFAFDTAVEDHSCALLSVIGDGGVGKTRLVDEFLEGIRDEATVMFGRALPYGEGMTYWPLAQALRTLDVDGRPTWGRVTDGAQHGEAIAMGLETIVGITDTANPPQMAWAFRRYLELLATQHPVVLVLDDVQWADEAVIDIVEGAAELSRDASILIVCMARPLLLEQRPHWGGGRMNTTTLVLAPLTAEDCRALLDDLLGQELPDELAARILTAADGNPLFLEELTASMADRGVLREVDGKWLLTSGADQVPVPGTVTALLSARLDALPADRRRMLDAASTIGQVFYPEALAKITDSETAADLEALVRADFIRPTASDVPGLDAYAFTHLTVQTAAYESLTFDRRAELHLAVGRWMDEQGDRPGLSDLALHHLERAAHFRQRIGTLDIDLSEEVASRMLRTAQLMLLSEPDHATLKLVDAALAIAPAASRTRADLHFERASLLHDMGRRDEALTESTVLAAVAAEMGWDEYGWRAWMLRAWSLFQEDVNPRDVARRLTEAEAALEGLHDVDGLALARGLEGLVAMNVHGDVDEALRIGDLILTDLPLSRNPRVWLGVMSYALDNYGPGPRPLPEERRALERVEEAIATRGWADHTRVANLLDYYRRRALARGGATDAAMEGIHAHLDLLEQQGEVLPRLMLLWLTAHTGWTAGDLSVASDLLADGNRTLKEIGNTATLSSWSALEALTRALMGDEADARRALVEARRYAHAEDLHAVATAELADAVLEARAGRSEASEELFTEARRRLEGTGFNETRLQLHVAQSIAREALGDGPGALACAQEALDLATWLEWVPAIAQAQRRIAALT